MQVLFKKHEGIFQPQYKIQRSACKNMAQLVGQSAREISALIFSRGKIYPVIKVGPAFTEIQPRIP